MQIVTEGITPGHAATVWLGAVQSPHLCAFNPCTPMAAMGMAEMNAVAVDGGGAVVLEDWKNRVSAFLPAGEVPTNMFETRFTEPEMSEYHLGVRDHGPLDVGLASDMLSKFRGGKSCVSRQLALFVPNHLRSN